MLVLIVLHSAHDHHGVECLEEVVVPVLGEVATHALHPVVGPVGVLDSVQESVVLGDPETVLELLKPHGGVEGVHGGVEGGDRVAVVATELLLGEVLVELRVGKLLEALGLLVLACNELGLEVVSL